jgi:hypothetical protein
MATPVTPATPGIISVVEKDIVFLKSHVIVLLLALVVIIGSILGGIGLVEHLVEAHDARVAANQLKKEGVDTATTAALLAKFQADEQAAAARDAQQTALIQTLIQQMAASRAQTAKQVSTDATLNAKDAGARLAQQTKAGAGDVTVAGDSVTMSLPLTRSVVADLDLLSQAQSDVTNLTGQLGAQTILTNDAKAQLADATKIIAADKTELIATIKADNAACVASTKIAVDAEAKKGRKRTFWSVVATIGGMAFLLK